MRHKKKKRTLCAFCCCHLRTMYVWLVLSGRLQRFRGGSCETFLKRGEFYENIQPRARLYR